MGKRYTKIPVDTMSNLQLNAGIIVDAFTPETGVIGNILSATTGGLNFTHTHEFVDLGDDIDNCPKNMKELKQIDNTDTKLSGTMLVIKPSIAKKLMIADIDSNDGTHLVPRNVLEDADFSDIWWVGDYGEDGSIALHLMNALSTAGFALQTTDKGKGQFAFEFTGHYSMDEQDTVPFEAYIADEASEVPFIALDRTYLELSASGGTYTFKPSVNPSNATITFTSSATGKASVNSAGKVTGASAGTTIITASITVDGITYSDTCTVVVS